MEQISKIEEKVEQLTQVQRFEIYEFARKVSRETIEEVCPALLRLESSKTN